MNGFGSIYGSPTLSRPLGGLIYRQDDLSGMNDSRINPEHLEFAPILLLVLILVTIAIYVFGGMIK